MNITATHINYYIICHRKLWLFANGIQMEHTSEAVAEGKFIHETAYPQRAERYREITLSFPWKNKIELFGKIDFYDAGNKIIHEIKKSEKMEEAHAWQVKFYIWLLELNGISGVKATLEYPRLRETREVFLSGEDKDALQAMIFQIGETLEQETCPEKIDKRFCKKCSYYELCYVME